MNIRLAEQSDIEPVLGLLKEFHSESLNQYSLFCNDDVARKAMEAFYQTSFILEIDGKIVGVLGGVVTKFPLSDELIYQEWVWFVTKEYRLHGISLYHALVDYCKINGIKKIIMVHMANSKADKLEKFYKRLGFTLMEKHYIKQMEN